jgi:hypothetical protein
MKAVIVYESEFGATKLVAQAIEMGLGERMHTELLNVHDAGDLRLARTDLLVVGAPTHGHRIPTADSRLDGEIHRDDAFRSHAIEPDALQTGVREWLTTIHLDQSHCAAFTTRAHMSLLLSGSAAPAILRALRRAGGARLAPPVAFLIEKTGALATNELRYAQNWGRRLGAAMEGAPGIPALARPR